MTISELIAHLTRIVEADEYAGDMQVTFGAPPEIIRGGVIAKDSTGLVVLNLAPISLDKVGGF